MKSLYESIMDNDSEVLKKPLEDTIRQKFVKQGNLFYYKAKDGRILTWRYLIYDRNKGYFEFKFDLYRNTFYVLIKSLSDLQKVENYWEIKDRDSKPSELNRLLKEIKNTFELI